ncbi:hypothetical protein EZV77_21645 [Burkholderia thailandensis]|nr:hypothetical protein [Burkholderia thailandensis]MDD1488653.1 hypothetical protein [Burkholderia thailandensis]MDD1494921.1 hypothetical protein [Burkholderia thailandensis]TBW59289.1 hypothetical protein EZV77_21645 [Burkholderia thailandensis]TGB34589.1 hypothetical protein C6946_05625 [Burkholderia thailandensis]
MKRDAAARWANVMKKCSRRFWRVEQSKTRWTKPMPGRRNLEGKPMCVAHPQARAKRNPHRGQRRRSAT